MICSCGRIVEPAYESYGMCEDCYSTDAARYHGRPQNVKPKQTTPKTRVTARHGNPDDVFVRLRDNTIFRLPAGESVTVLSEDFAEAYSFDRRTRYTISRI